MQEATDFQLGDRVVRPSLNRVDGPEGAIQLEPRVMRVLIHLSERPGEVVTRDELLERVWEGVFVSDDSLTRSISDLRKILGDDPLQPRYIETIRSVGYRLIAPVEYNPTGDALPGKPEGQVAPATPAVPTAVSPSNRSRSVRRLSLALAVTVVLLGSVLWLQLSRASESSSGRFPRTTPFTTLRGVEKDPAFSPDGSRVAFVWTADQNVSGDLYVKRFDEESLLRLTENFATERSPAWSPDGRNIAFMRIENGACAVVLIPADGGSERSLAECTPISEASLAWSPDGQTLALPGRLTADSPVAIVLFSVETQEVQAVTVPENAADLYPVFSPDGTKLSFVRFTSNRVGDLHIVPVEGGRPEQLTFDSRFILGHPGLLEEKHVLEVLPGARTDSRQWW